MSSQSLALLIACVLSSSLVTGCLQKRGSSGPRAGDAGAAGERQDQDGDEPAEPTTKKKKPKVTSSKKPSDETDDKGPAEPEETGDATCYKGDAAVCLAEFRVFELTNQLRAARGKEPLTFSPKASFVARDWSSKQAQGGFISHDGFPNQRQSLYQQEFGGRMATSAENVAMTGGSSDPASEFVDMWTGSFGHLRNMLGNHKVLGVGLARASDGSWYATQIFGAE